MTAAKIEEVALGEADAQRLTERIRNRMLSIRESIDRLYGLLAEAYSGQAWRAMGYSSWEEYTGREFGVDRVRLDRDDRRDLVVSLRSAGMSTRAIGTALGVDNATVHRDARVADATPGQVVGLDGKKYTRKTYTPADADELAADDTVRFAHDPKRSNAEETVESRYVPPEFVGTIRERYKHKRKGLWATENVVAGEIIQLATSIEVVDHSMPIDDTATDELLDELLEASRALRRSHQVVQAQGAQERREGMSAPKIRSVEPARRKNGKIVGAEARSTCAQVRRARASAELQLNINYGFSACRSPS